MRRVVVVVVAVLAACSGAKPHLTTPLVLVVIDPGAEPRQLLRYTPPALHVPERAEVRLKIRGSAAFTNTVLENGRSDADAPTVRLVARLEATGTTPAGETLISYELEDASVLGDFVDARMHQLVETEVAALKGLRGTWQRAPSGLISAVVFDTARLTRANRAGLSGVADAILQTFVRLPDVPVGIGATWRSEYDETYGGIEWHTTVTDRLKDLSGSYATIEVTMAMRAASQAVSVEPNASVRLTSAERNTTQLLTVPLDHLTASGETRDSAEMNLLVVRGRLRVVSTLHLEVLGWFQALAGE